MVHSLLPAQLLKRACSNGKQIKQGYHQEKRAVEPFRKTEHAWTILVILSLHKDAFTPE